ncbi:hypothetical protein [Paenibacillus elgii]|uniref:hypothetical protein n=1 Tax=Paenibacillus elgii TaxID=189691 RepID=UPI0020413F17|nr:hypothetical protein [Paenibacillus elgii]MCM3272959.1 hypothetical protein [Paenibacillus elgii]
MSKIVKAREYFEKARAISGGTDRFMLEAKKKLTAEISAIDMDQRLSEAGKREATAETRKKHAIEFLQKSHTMKQEYVTNLKKAVKEADTVIYAAVPKPDATKLQRFEAELREFKTQLMLTPRADRGYAMLTQFIGRLDDPYMAGIVREQFADLAQPILSAAGGDADRYRLRMAQSYEKLKSDFEAPEVKEARQIFESAQAMVENPRIYSVGIVSDAATEAFGREYGQYINNTDRFFEANKELKPADYVDPEEAKKSTAIKSDDEEWKTSYRALRQSVEEATKARERLTATYDELLGKYQEAAE